MPSSKDRLKAEAKADQFSAAHQEAGGVGFAGILGVMAAAKPAFELISQSFFMVSWTNEIFASLWKTIAFGYSYQKNMHKTGNLVLDYAKFGLSTFLLFGAASLTAVGQIACLGAMLLLSPVACFTKASYFFGKMLTANNQQERESHFKEMGKNLLGVAITGVVSTCVTALFLVPGLNAAMTALATVVTTVIIGPPLATMLGSKIAAVGSEVWNTFDKWNKKRKGFVGPKNKYNFEIGKNLENSQLKKNIIYIDDIKNGVVEYRIKDKHDVVREGFIKEPADVVDGSWPTFFDDKAISKLRLNFKSFAHSFVNAKPMQYTSSTSSNSSTSSIAKQLFVDKTSKTLSKEFFGEVQPLNMLKPKLNQKTSQDNFYQSGISHSSSSAANTLTNNEQHQKYLGKERSDYFAHVSAAKLNSVDELNAEVDRQISRLIEQKNQLREPANHRSFSRLFQSTNSIKNTIDDKIKALEVLKTAVNEWNNLYQQKDNISYESIRLDNQVEINQVLNPHHDPKVTANRERIIKRIEQHVLVNYPKAYQSFRREQGSVETVFKQGFDLMRLMKTETEINKQRQGIEKEISDYESKYENKHDTKRSDSITLLRDYLEEKVTDREVATASDIGITESRQANGTRSQIFQKIKSLHASEKLLDTASSPRLSPSPRSTAKI